MSHRACLPLLFASLFATCAFTACGNDDVTIGPADASAPDDATASDAPIGRDGAGDASFDDAADAADAAEDLSKLTCSELSAAYSAELAKSHTCNVNAFANECTAPRERILGCGCETFVNANAVARLDQIVAAWTTKKCSVACPAALCQVAAGGACGKGGICVDVSSDH